MPSPDLTPSPLSVFISYSHRDEDYKDDLVVHLATLKRQGKICAWQDRDIEAGAEWDAEIKQQLESAEIILLMITPRFLASDYCYDLEMQRAVQRHDEGTARVIPIIVKPCDWQGTPFSKLQVVPKDAKPITKWDDQDDAFLDVVKGIRRAVESLQEKKPQGATAPNPSTRVAPNPSSTHSPTHPPTHSPTHPLTHPPTQFSTYNPATFTGRKAETATLTHRLQESCRIVAIVGMTGIGKTALAERVVANLMDSTDTQLPYYRFSLDDRSLTPDFSSSGAALLRELGDEPTLADQQDPVNLLNHLLERLRRQPCRVQIDSLERLLQGNEQEGWSEFCDPLWLDLLQKFLAGTHCSSQLILTSQDIPADLEAVASRYPQFWHCEPLQGLSAAEQRDLFQKLGLSLTDPDWDILQRIGTYYDGHPLVLQVIAEEIRQPPFRGNIALYWQHHEAEFTATATPTNPLAQSRLFRRRVRQRVEQSLQRLPEPARQMLCACAVFRRPVPIEFWYAMLPEADAHLAFDTLQDRHLIEYATHPPTHSPTHSPFLIRQHNLIRSIAYALLKTNPAAWEAAERQAAHLWLTAYQPAPDAPNLETVRGYLEAFDHYCSIKDWGVAANLVNTNLTTGTRLDQQLFIWGHFQELIPLYLQWLTAIQAVHNQQMEVRIFNGLGNTYHRLGEYKTAISFYEKSLELSKRTGYLAGEGAAKGGLGSAYFSLGQYEQAIEFYQQDLDISKTIHDRRGEGQSLGNLGNIYHELGNWEQALECFQKSLVIAQEIGDSQGRIACLGNIGTAYRALGQYELAIEYYHQSQAIASKIGDRVGEGRIIGNLGNIYFCLGKYKEAVNCQQQFLNVAREVGDRQAESYSLGNLGMIYYATGQYHQAIDFYKQLLSISLLIGDGLAEAGALVNIGEAQIKLEQYSDALTSNQIALKIFQEIKVPVGEAQALKNLAELHQALGEVEVARQYAQQALALATELSIPLKAECESLLSELEQGADSEP